MTGIYGVSAAASVSVGGGGSGSDPARLAADAIGTIGGRVLAWVSASSRDGGAGAQAWAIRTGAAEPNARFRPDAAELARGGDVYGLNGLSADIAAQVGATPAEEGAILRALTDFTRAAVVQAAGLSGASGEAQTDGLSAALDVAVSADAGGGAAGVIDRIESATASLARLAG